LKYATCGSALILLPFAPGMIIGGFLGGKIMGAVGKELGGAIFGDGSNGQAWTELGFETAGMFIGSKVGNSIAPPPLTNRLMNADVNQAGWPTLPGKQAVNFSNVEPVTLQPGTKIYRIIESQEGANGSYWARDLPTSKSQWRSDYAVSEQWNKDGQYVEYTVTEPLQVWEGGAAPQLVGTEYLPGGANQIWLPKGTVTPGEPVSTGW
jgi:hypothetical protein